MGDLAGPDDDGFPPDRTQAILEAAKEVASLLKAGGPVRAARTATGVEG
ncbi:hypothetical protein ABZ517_07025 [Streptomyces scabiei]